MAGAILLGFLFILATVVEGAEIRSPAVSGQFYPANKMQLKGMVETYLQRAEKKTLPGELVGLICPHAGYIYSGQVAAYSYKRLEGKNFPTVILLGPSHRGRFPGVSVGNYRAYRTPLGNIPVDQELAEKLIKEEEMIRFISSAHHFEHSLEVQLPFLQTVLKDFKIVPIVFGDRSFTTCQMVSQALLKVAKDRKVLFIASTDLSHYHPYQEANEIDKKTVWGVEKQRAKYFATGVDKNEYELCGASAVITFLLIKEGFSNSKISLLKYANSGDFARKDKSKVVGYVAMALTQPKSIETYKPLSKKAQEALLKIARRAIEEYAKTRNPIEAETKGLPELLEKRGVFVTLTKNGRLRGCIGQHTAEIPLYKMVPRVAVSSAFFDRRFSPVRKSEIDDLHLEISVYLSPVTKIDALSQFKVGKHGIIMQKGSRGATYLPKVATEQGWDKEETLKSLCRKAGLPTDAWKDKDTQFFIYSTQVFSEE